MELSTQGLVTDGVGKLSSSLHSPCRSVPGVSASLSLRLSSSLPAASLFLRLSLTLLAPVSYLPAPSFGSVVGRVQSLSLHAPPAFFAKAGKQDDISGIVSKANAIKQDVIERVTGRNKLKRGQKKRKRG